MASENTEDEACSKSISKCKSSSRFAKISLEGYLHFFDYRTSSGFSINHLNQIIAMHGYKRIHKNTKKVIVEAISGMQLVNPRRSTLHQEISPAESAATNLQSVIDDLSELDWQECTITSVEEIGPTKLSLAGTSDPSASAPKKCRAKGFKALSDTDVKDKAKGKSKGRPKGWKRVALMPKENENDPVSDAANERRAAKKKKCCC